MDNKLTRRALLREASSAGLLVPLTTVTARAGTPNGAGEFLELIRPPDAAWVFVDSGIHSLASPSEGRWQAEDIEVTVVPQGEALAIGLSAPRSGVKRIHLRWRGRWPASLRLLGDHWERGYGDFEWRGIVPGRVMPWYFLAFDGRQTHGYGVKTGPGAFCFWMADPEGVSLWADVRSGGMAVQLGQRRLEVCSVVGYAGQPGEAPFTVQRALCRLMCPGPRLAPQPIYGFNDWYYAYGNNTATRILEDCRRLAALSPAGPNRPFSVIDDGWQSRGREPEGPWTGGNARFGSMEKLAEQMREAGTRPGIWVRPLAGAGDTPAAWRLNKVSTLDPTVPEVKQKIAADIARLRQWGYQLIKHDYTTYDILGRWGFALGATLTDDGWSFKGGRTQTTAEVIRELYQTIRAAADEALLIGCNTVSHLSAGVFEANRIGDDTSGRDWDRTRRMGINSLAFRAAHHGTFYAVDGDCVGLTRDMPWELNRQWLDLLARSGTALFVSAQKEALGPEQEKALREAFAVASAPQPLGEPLDWMKSTCPRRWRFGTETVEFNWMGPAGASPFPS